MKTITTDTWDDELWGVVSAEENHHDSLLPATPSRQQDQQDQYTKLYFYFGTNDHWVADETRDELIAARASYTCSSTTTEEKENAQQGNGRSGSKSKSRRPIMEIDHQDTPHGFCIGEFFFSFFYFHSFISFFPFFFPFCFLHYLSCTFLFLFPLLPFFLLLSFFSLFPFFSF
jgi:hypothetical protein